MLENLKKKSTIQFVLISDLFTGVRLEESTSTGIVI